MARSSVRNNRLSSIFKLILNQAVRMCFAGALEPYWRHLIHIFIFFDDRPQIFDSWQVVAVATSPSPKYSEK